MMRRHLCSDCGDQWFRRAHPVACPGCGGERLVRDGEGPPVGRLTGGIVLLAVLAGALGWIAVGLA